MVSIHAPAWGATYGKGDIDHMEKVSIHAPAWGATLAPKIIVCSLHVSIHAPAWGATAAVLWKKFGTGMFQSTHPRGVRQAVVA